MKKLDYSPGIEEICAEAVDTQQAVGFQLITNRMLHEGIGDEYEEAGDPATQRYSDRRHEVIARPQTLFAPDECADESTLEKEGEHAFHREGLSDHSAGVFGEL